MITTVVNRNTIYGAKIHAQNKMKNYKSKKSRKWKQSLSLDVYDSKPCWFSITTATKAQGGGDGSSWCYNLVGNSEATVPAGELEGKLTGW